MTAPPPFQTYEDHIFDQQSFTTNLSEKHRKNHWYFTLGYLLGPPRPIPSYIALQRSLRRTCHQLQHPNNRGYFLQLLKGNATITPHNTLHLPVGGQIVEFRHATISTSSQLPKDIPIERHAWVRIRDPNCDKRKLSEASWDTLQWSKQSLLPLLSSIPLNRSTHLAIQAAADAFAVEQMLLSGEYYGHWWLGSAKLKYFLVQSNLGQIRPYKILASQQKSPTLHYILGSIGSAMHHPRGTQTMYPQTWHH